MVRLALATLIAGAACAYGGDDCYDGCSAADTDIRLVVAGPADAIVDGVQVAFSGPVSGELQCGNQFQAVCHWPPGYVIAGTYSLVVSAPGYQTATISATLTTTYDSCGCEDAELAP